MATLFRALTDATLFIGLMLVLVPQRICWSAAHLFVLFYEEPALRRTFGAEYEADTQSRRRWTPRWRS